MKKAAIIGTVGCSCGLCCHETLPCDNCLNNTLKANGISTEDINIFKGLSNKVLGYQDSWSYSELYKAIKSYLLKMTTV